MPTASSSTAPYDLADDKLLAECRFEAFVASGPGGQKRHKTNAAVRITHLPTGVHAVATDSRSQRENKIHALRTLRHKLAIESVRNAVDPLTFHVPAWLVEYPGLHISPKNPRYPGALALLLDVLKSTQWSVPRAAAILNVSSSALSRFLHDDHHIWSHVNQTRTSLGMKPLTPR